VLQAVKWDMGIFALVSLISGKTIRAGVTRRKRIPINEKIPTFAPLDHAEIQSPSGTNLKKTIKKISATTDITIKNGGIMCVSPIIIKHLLLI